MTYCNTHPHTLSKYRHEECQCDQNDRLVIFRLVWIDSTGLMMMYILLKGKCVSAWLTARTEKGCHRFLVRTTKQGFKTRVLLSVILMRCSLPCLSPSTQLYIMTVTFCHLIPKHKNSINNIIALTKKKR